MNKLNKMTSALLVMMTLSLQAQNSNDITEVQTQKSKETIKNIEKQWVDGLIRGKDMSILSQSYATQLKKLKPHGKSSIPITHNNYQEIFDKRYKDYVNDINSLAKLDKKIASKKWENKVIFLKKSYELAKKSQKRLLKHLKEQQQLFTKKDSAVKKQQLLTNTIQIVNGKISVETDLLMGSKAINKFNQLSDWNQFISGQKFKHKTISLIEKAFTIVRPTKILRNSSLPYAGREYSAPILTYIPEVTPSYSNQNAMPVNAEDLSEDIVVQFSPAINQLAADLGNDYLKIVNYVRQNIQLQYYAGAQKGAYATLASKAGNDIDQAALLIALLRRSNVPARFVQGVIRQPINEAMATLGIYDANQVLLALNKAGISHEAIIEGGQVVAIHRQYTWVSAYISYGNYRGSTADLSSKTWLPLAPAIKQDSIDNTDYDYQQAGFSSDDMVIDYLTSTGNQSPLLFWKNQVQADITNNYPNLTYQEILEREHYNTSYYQLLPASLPFEVIVATNESASLSNDQIQSLTIQMGENAELLDVTLLLPEVAGKRLTLSYLPATVDDQNIINQAGGMALVEPYLVDLRPVIKVDGKQINASNAPVPMAQFRNLTLTFNSPAGSEFFNRTILIGNYLVLSVHMQNDKPLLNQEEPNIYAEETRPSRIMYNLVNNYNKKWNESENEIAAVLDVALIKPIPSLTIISPEYNIVESQGLTTQIQFKGISIDAVTHSVDGISRNNISQNEYDFYRLSSLQGSYLESSIFQTQWAVDAISADKGMKRQASVLSLTPNNYQTLLNASLHDSVIKEEIEGWLLQGYHVIMPNNPEGIDSWQGSSWHVYHPQKGYSGYFISGIYAGGQTTQAPNEWGNSSLYNQLLDPYNEGSNEDPLSAVSIEIIETSNNQLGTVNEILEMPLIVIVKDKYNNPVRNALVKFEVFLSQASLIDPQQLDNISTSQMTVLSNEQGIGKIMVQLSDSINLGKLTVLNLGDPNLTKIGVTYIKTSISTQNGRVFSDEIFNLFSKPSNANEIELICWSEGIQCLSLVSPGGSRSGIMHYRVVDQFGNTVSNTSVTISSQGQNKTESKQSKQSNKQYDIVKVNGETDLVNRIDSNIPNNKNNSGYKSSSNDENCSVDDDPPGPGPKLILGSYDEGENAGPFEDYQSAKIALKDNCDEQSLSAPACSSETKQSISNYFFSTFYVYSPVSGGVNISLSASSLPTKSTSISINNWRNRDDYKYLVHGQNHYIGPFGIFPASRPGGTISLKKALYIGKTIKEGTSYYLDKLPDSLQTEYTVYDDECESETFDDGTVEISASGNGSLNISIAENDFDQFNYSLPTTPGRANFTVDVDIAFPSYQDDSYDFTLSFVDYVYAASIEVQNIIPAYLNLNSDSRLINPVIISTQINPADYLPESLYYGIYENGSIIDEGEAKYPNGSHNEIYFDYKGKINPQAIYEIELILNKGTQFEIRSDRTPIQGFKQQIVTKVSCGNTGGAFSGGACGGRVINDKISSMLSVQTSIDVSDPLVCRNEGIEVYLNSDATVSIELDKLDETGNPTGEITTLASETYPAGNNIIPVTADLLGNGQFDVKISSTSLTTGNSEVVTGKLNSVFEIKDSLLIGHAVVKGVDLADGSMIYSKKDISLPSLGADLEFIRTYSNKNRYDLGPLGYGWSHNYMSRVTIGNCGRIYVSGADGGTARFRIVNDEIIPMKGFHSTLISNQDGSFSFYSKNGTHYHYVKRQTRVWWLDYIEDANNNKLTIHTIRSNGAPIIDWVRDSVGRTFIYTYTTMTFNNQTGQLLSNITGPEGINIDFTYSEEGHLLTAKREGDSTNETYQYSSQQSGFNIHLLTQITDNATGAIRNYDYENKTIVLPSGIPISKDIKDKQIASITETDGGSTTFSYTYTSGFNDSAIINQNGTITTYTLNDYGAATKIVAPNGTKSMTWQIADEILLLSEIDENGRTKSFEYDSNANLTKESIGGISRQYTYKPAGTQPPFIKDRIKSYTNWRGKTTDYTYDSSGNKIGEALGGISINYTYNSKGLVSSINDGNGKSQNITYDLYGQQDTITDAVGNSTTTKWDQRGRKTSHKDGNGNITYFDYDYSDRITRKTLGTRTWDYTYLNGGLTKTETDPNSHATKYTYDKMGRLVQIKNADTKLFTYEYDNNGNKLSENDFNGNLTTFNYDNANRLETKTEPLGKITAYTYDNVGNVLTETTGDRSTTYTYDPKRYFLTSIDSSGAKTSRTVDGEGNITTEIDPNGNSTTFSYDDFNRVTLESGPSSSGRSITYDGNGNITNETTFNNMGNQSRSYSYDSANRRKTYTDGEENTTTYTYDGNNNALTETKPQGYKVTYTYNNLNLVTSKTISSSNWQYIYDDAGNLSQETLPNGNVITTTYDILNRPLVKSDTIGLISEFSYDDNSNIATEKDGNGNTTSYSYNALNQRTTANKPLSRNHTYAYTIFGEMTSDTGPNGTITYGVNTLGQRTSASGSDGYDEVYNYDFNDNLMSFTDSRDTLTTYGINDLNQTTSQTTESFSKTFTYDTIGNKLTETDYNGNKTEYTYDKENRLLTTTRAGQLQQSTKYNTGGLAQKVTDANGNSTVHQYNDQYYRTQTNLPETQVIKYTLNAFGDVEIQDNPGHNDITRVYDKRRRLTSESNGASNETQYEYDLNNNRTTVIKPDNTRWEYTYDEANRLISIVNSLEAITTTYGYDAKDNLISIKDAMNKTTTFDYDNRNRKTAKNYPGNDKTDYGYDDNGNLKTVDYPNGTGIIYGYDSLNRKTSENYSGPYGSGSVTYTLDDNGNSTNISESITGNNYSTSQSFDAFDRMTTHTDVYGNAFQYEYDDNGNRKLMKDYKNGRTDYSYDGLNRLTTLGYAGLGTFNWTYNTAGLTKKIDYPNGASVEYLYDDANRITSIRNIKSGADISKHLYTYDSNGNRLTMTESNIHSNQLITYGYDRADRLTSVTYPNNEKTTYQLDKVGNRDKEIITGTTPNTKTFTYNNRDQLTGINDTLGSSTSYTYDNAGNQLTKDTDGLLTTFDYSPRHRVKSITVGAQVPINYQYDYTGQRINYERNGSEKRYLYDGLTLIAETNTIGNTIARYHYGDRYQLAEQRNSENSYYHVDSLGTNVAVTNQDGSIQARYEYDAYGNLLTQAGSSETPFGFTGYQKDEDTGLYYANARYYDSNTGRFLREDPNAGNPNKPPSLHRYLYANANPTVYVDPNGQIAVLKSIADWFSSNSASLRESAVSLNGVQGNIFQRGAAKTAAVGLGILGLSQDLVGGAVSGVNTTANVAVTGVDNLVGGGNHFSGIRAENRAFEDATGSAVETLVKENISLIPQAYNAVSQTVGSAFNGDTGAIFDVTRGTGAVALGGYGLKSAYSNLKPVFRNQYLAFKMNKILKKSMIEADIDARVNLTSDAFRDVFVGESKDNKLILKTLENNKKPLFTLNNVTQNDLNRLDAIRQELLTVTKGVPGFNSKFRSNLRKGFKPALGFADAIIDGKSFSFKSFSTHNNSIEGYAPLLPNSIRQLETDIIGHDRKVDVEAKILEQIMLRTNANSTGVIRMIVDRKSCDSCKDTAIPDFSKQRPKIDIEIIQIDRSKND